MLWDVAVTVGADVGCGFASVVASGVACGAASVAGGAAKFVAGVVADVAACRFWRRCCCTCLVGANLVSRCDSGC